MQLTAAVMGTSVGQYLTLVVGALVAIGCGSLVFVEQQSSVWSSWIVFMDPALQTAAVDFAPTSYNRVFLSIYTLVCLVYNMVLSAIIVDNVRRILAHLHQKHSRVLGKNHILIIGYGNGTVALMRELVQMMKDENKRPSLVLLCEDGADAIKDMSSHPDLKPVEVREGSYHVNDLEKAGAFDCEGIVYAHGYNEEDDSKLMGVLFHLFDKSRGKIVVSRHSESTRFTVDFLRQEGMNILSIDVSALLFAISAKMAVNPKIALMIRNLLSFENENLILLVPNVDDIGKTLDHLYRQYKHVIICGFIRNDALVERNPFQKCKQGDRLLAIAADMHSKKNSRRGTKTEVAPRFNSPRRSVSLYETSLTVIFVLCSGHVSPSLWKALAVDVDGGSEIIVLSATCESTIQIEEVLVKFYKNEGCLTRDSLVSYGILRAESVVIIGDTALSTAHQRDSQVASMTALVNTHFEHMHIVPVFEDYGMYFTSKKMFGSIKNIWPVNLAVFKAGILSMLMYHTTIGQVLIDLIRNQRLEAIPLGPQTGISALRLSETIGDKTLLAVYDASGRTIHFVRPVDQVECSFESYMIVLR